MKPRVLTGRPRSVRGNKFKRYGVVTLCVGIALLPAMVGCSTNATHEGQVAKPQAAPPEPTAAAKSDWMRDKLGKGQVSLKEVAIPGTHDSDTSAIVESVGPQAKKCSDTYIVGSSPFNDHAPACIIAKLAKAQYRSVAQQLADGIRYLDLRVGITKAAAPSPEGKIVTNHGLVSRPLSSTLSEIADFAKAHPKEQVILHFQKVELPEHDRKPSSYWHKIFNNVVAAEGSADQSICKRSWSRDQIPVRDESLGDVRISTPWSLDRNLLVLVPPSTLAELKAVTGDGTASCYRDGSAALHTPWPNEHLRRQVEMKNEQYLDERKLRQATRDCNDKAGQNWCGLFVSQLQLSPGAGIYSYCVTTGGGSPASSQWCSLRRASELSNPHMTEAFEDWHQERLPVNIAIVDDYTSPASDRYFDYTNQVINLN